MSAGDRMKTLAELGEDGVIACFAAAGPAPGPDVLVPNGDDAAAFRLPPGEAAVVTTDSLVEGVHFDFGFSPARAVGRKLIGVNASDLAAMGARPRYALISVCADQGVSADRIAGIAAGIGEACHEEGIVILGGNTTRIAGPLVLSATLIGVAAEGRLLRRAGSVAGDRIYVTGTLGDARAALAVALGPKPSAGPLAEALLARLIAPRARVAAGLALAETGAVHGMCDVSDGLGKDLRRLLAGERLGARIDAAAIPISAALAEAAAGMGADPLAFALAGGEDYELLFTAAPGSGELIRAACLQARTPVTEIGVVAPGGFVVERAGAAGPLPEGYDHFLERRSG